MININRLRREYSSKKLDLKDLNRDPFLQFKIWFEEAKNSGTLEPNSMTLATASKQGKPSSRTILLKEIDDRGFIFFTNYESRKAHELDENPFASLTFFWAEIEKQIIIEGTAEKLEEQKNENYFSIRPRGSQIGAWASHQDQVIDSKTILEQEYEAIKKKYEGKLIPKPPYWGGYRVIPTKFEFWQGRENRLHDRFQYSLEESIWLIVQLSP